MKRYKITVKLINVRHEDWTPYMHNIMEEFKITFTVQKDTYVCMGDDDVFNQINIVADIFESRGQTILINSGGI